MGGSSFGKSFYFRSNLSQLRFKAGFCRVLHLDLNSELSAGSAGSSATRGENGCEPPRTPATLPTHLQ